MAAKPLIYMATPAGVEPATSRLEISRSIQMSYGALFIEITNILVNNRTIYSTRL